MDILDGVGELRPKQIPAAFMPINSFARAGGAHRAVLTMSTVPNGAPHFGDRPVIRLSRMAMARDMISQLGLRLYNKGLYKPNADSDQMVAWVRYDLPSREKPFEFKLRKTYGGPRRSEEHAWESLCKALIQEIMLETGYNVDDINYRFCNVACGQFDELHRIAGGATLMAHCAQESERVATQSLNEVMEKLARIAFQYDDVLPFSKVKEAGDDGVLSGRMEELARELINLAWGDAGLGLDSVD